MPIQHLCLGLLCLFVACSSPKPPASDGLQTADWETISAQAAQSTVNMMMWQGDPLINAYMREYVVPSVQEKYGIDLQIANGQGNAIVQLLMTEKQALKSASQIDLMWINGETFYQLRQLAALHGPWTGQLPNIQYVNLDNRFIGTDFQQPINGYECPWGNVQMTLIYDSLRVQNPPQTRAELLTFVKANPGVFTFDTHFTGLTLLKAWLIDIAGAGTLDGAFDEAAYAKYAPQLWDYIRAIRPFLWKEGRTFPEAVAPMHQLFANGELWFTMSNNDSEVDNKISQGVFPATARAYVPTYGTIQNSHYLGIADRAPNKAGAMVVVNFLISPAAQLKKQDPQVWGDGTVLEINRLPDEWKAQFTKLTNRKYAPPRAVIEPLALQELAPEYMIRLAEDFRTQIINQ